MNDSLGVVMMLVDNINIVLYLKTCFEKESQFPLLAVLKITSRYTNSHMCVLTYFFEYLKNLCNRNFSLQKLYCKVYMNKRAITHSTSFFQKFLQFYIIILFCSRSHIAAPFLCVLFTTWIYLL